MPSVSKKQHNLMAMVANDPAAAKRLGIPQTVGKEFTAADKGRNFKKGGDPVATKDMKAALAKHASKPASKAHAGLKSGGAVKKGIDGVAKKGKTQGKEIVMKKGGMCK